MVARSHCMVWVGFESLMDFRNGAEICEGPPPERGRVASPGVPPFTSQTRGVGGWISDHEINAEKRGEKSKKGIDYGGSMAI